MTEAIVSAIAEQLISILREEIQQEVRLVVGVENEVERLSLMFNAIQAVLNNAEERQLDKDVRFWLDKLRDTAYDMDDVLDEWNTEILRSRLERASNASVGMLKKVCTTYFFSACFCFKQLGLRRDISLKIKDLKERLDMISTEKDRFRFIESSSESRIKKQEEQKRPQTTSLIDDSDIFGRTSDKDFIVSKLLGESSQLENGHQVPIISIVGMGGLGKTTLAQQAYNNKDVKTQFPEKIWVCVSEPFEKVRIAKEIIKVVVPTAPVDDIDEWNETLHQRLSNSVEGKLFLLVLDDVWTEDYTEWDPLRISLNFGARGSRIVITTRSKRVALKLGANYIHGLGKLSDEDCWLLLSHMAFVGRTKDECAKLEEIGRKIAVKCEGLPLSAKTLGSLLRIKRMEQEWLNVLQSTIWNEVVKDVLPSLFLSYNDFPSHLKRCFTYCAIFPKDYWMKKDTLINMWMAQGFLNSSLTDLEKTEETGSAYCNELVMRSFFQHSKSSYTDEIYFTLHDLLHDFAQFLTKNEISVMEVKSHSQEMDCGNVRHLTLKWNNEDTDCIPSFCNANKLRTLQFLGRSSENTGVPFNLFKHLTCLRTLALNGNNLGKLPSEVGKLIHLRYLDLSFTKLQELPSEVGKLIHLRYLDLSSTQLRELPSEVGKLKNLIYLNLRNTMLEKLPEMLYNLQNLQTLNLEGFGYNELPEGIEKLIDLRHFLFSINSLRYLPQGIGKLSSLCTLSEFIVGGGSMGEGGCKIGELKALELLQGKIVIRGLERVSNGNEVKEAELKNKKHLRNLTLSFGRNGEEIIVEETTMESVLEGLQPHPELEHLTINDYSGTKLPNWMVMDYNLVLTHLVSLRLYRCTKCEHIPSTLGKLPCLEILELHQMNVAKYTGSLFPGVVGGGDSSGDGGVETFFPKLKKLVLEDMCNLEELYLDIKEAEDGRNIIFMPCLDELVLRNCCKLKALTPHISLATPLRKLNIWKCPELTWTPSFCLEKLPYLEGLSVGGMDEVKYFGTEFSGVIREGDGGGDGGVERVFPKLKSLRIKESYNFLEELDLGIKEEDDGRKINFMPCLVSLYVTSCHKLKALTCRISSAIPLKVLVIDDCPEISWTPPSCCLLLPYIEKLYLWDNAGEFTRSLAPNNHICLSNLKSLFIYQSPLSSVLPEGLSQLTTLQNLYITSSPPLRKEDMGEDWSKISRIPYIEINHKRVQ